VDRFTWGIVVGAVLLVAAGLASVTVLQRPPAPTDLSTPEGVVRAYVTAIETQHPDEAWDLLTAGARGGLTRDEFVRRTSAQSRPRSGRLAIDSVAVEGSTARVELSRTYEGSGGLFGSSSYSTTNTVRLEREGGQWRISVPPEPYLLERAFPPAAPAPAVVTVVVTPAPGVTPTPFPTPVAAPATVPVNR
jgi:hypothetical protein